MQRNCERCQKVFEAPAYKVRRGHGRFCSRSCSKMGHPQWNTGRTHFKKGASNNVGESNPMYGKTPWNKGLAGFMEGEKNNRWVGDKVGYAGLHSWVKRKLGKAAQRQCEECGSNSNVQWANVSYEYKRDVSDWRPLCQSCHQLRDRQSGNYGLASRMRERKV